MKRILNKQDVMEMLYGSCLMGAGGGGSLESGTGLLEAIAMEREISVPMITVDEMGDNEYACAVAGMGSPLKFKERGGDFRVEPVQAFDSLEKIGFFMNRKVKYTLPVEYGALNTLVPMIVSMEKGVPFLDADGTGRAVPALNTLLFSVNGIPLAPIVMTNDKGDTVVAYPNDPYDAEEMENIGRQMCQAYNMVMGIGGWMSSRDQIQDLLVPGAYTLAQKAGKALLNSKENGLDPMDELKKVLECNELWRGKLNKFEALSDKGFDFGHTYFEGIGKYEGKTYKIDYQNENLVAYEGDTPILTVPDLICFVNLDTCEPMSNADVAEGQNVLVLSMPVAENWYKKGNGFDCWRSFLNTVGYNGEQIKY